MIHYQGGSVLTGLNLVSGCAIHMFDISDYLASPARTTLTNAHRIFPGNGVAPLNAVLRTLHSNGFRGFLSLELFNRDYWQQDPLQVAKTGLPKMRESLAGSMAP